MNMKKSKQFFDEYQKYVLEVTPFRAPILASAEGSYYKDIDGNRYLDLMGGQFCEVLGHGDEELAEVVYQQSKKILHTNTLCLTEEVLEACRALSEITNDTLQKTILLSTGAEAVECALRYARFYTKKDGIVSITNGYHGLTLATQSISSGGAYAHPLVPGSHFIPTPDWHNRPADVDGSEYIAEHLQAAEEYLSEFEGTIAAFIIEPVVSVGGMIYLPKEYFAGLAEIAKKHGALLIYDECQTGLGRLGTWFGYERTGIVPDILVLAKAAGLGFPVSAVMFSQEIAEAVEGKFIHFSSHQNDPFSARMVLHLINTIKKEDMLSKILETGEYFVSRLQELSKKSALLLRPRGEGLMISFDLPEEYFTETNNPGMRLIDLLEQRGVMVQAIQKGKTFRIIPSYRISRDEIDFCIETLETCLQILEKEL
ncbi:aspartate aminotransferase family protein [Candidatus Woesebacteria bacterium]|nr:aspartate aminotransferase family protein [Candidatus Woesebacteria bacterium]MCD8506846.1 aspartate aminotransferase family protein [Candidatus Woesebacteria bacterium]